MVRERMLKVVLVLLGLVFLAAAYPLVVFYAQEPALAMMLSLYFTLGFFLLLAVRSPAEHRSLIAFSAYSSFAHGAVMAIQAYKKVIPGHEVIGVAVMFVGRGRAAGAGTGEGIKQARIDCHRELERDSLGQK